MEAGEPELAAAQGSWVHDGSQRPGERFWTLQVVLRPAAGHAEGEIAESRHLRCLHFAINVLPADSRLSSSEIEDDREDLTVVAGLDAAGIGAEAPRHPPPGAGFHLDVDQEGAAAAQRDPGEEVGLPPAGAREELLVQEGDLRQERPRGDPGCGEAQEVGEEGSQDRLEQPVVGRHLVSLETGCRAHSRTESALRPYISRKTRVDSFTRSEKV